ncbi:Bax inhibitor-1/YccA family protein [Methyloradius palustris]|uniref:BAX inhibitor protein n=1 Tax=Methyloradius palustris TaxID=2778876 RepID=A0A8D5G7M8_9PROT|nr:Bax inhibitor-1/YccA family protein [Methyloradius palustris]BCM24637.1 BAX inhibitor protein [Methyloradius palustris]
MDNNYQVLGRNTEVLSDSANKVLRNTYALLGMTMIPTVIGAFIGVSLDLSLFAQHPIMAVVGMLVISFGLIMGIKANSNSSVGVVLLLAFTLFMGVMLGPILQVALHLRNGAQLIGMAAGGTGIIFLTLAGIATTTKKDFSFMGKFLMVGIIMLIVASLANMFFQIPAFQLALSGVGVLLFSGFILYDVSRIVNGGETNYIMATLNIYLDIYNLFVNLLQILMAVFGDRD